MEDWNDGSLSKSVDDTKLDEVANSLEHKSQNYLDKLEKNSETYLVKINKVLCKVLYLGQNN